MVIDVPNIVQLVISFDGQYWPKDFISHHFKIIS